MDVSGYTPDVSDTILRDGNGDHSRPVTVLDVSRQSGVSTATVSRVINESSKVSPATRVRVLKAIEALGYMRNHSARALARQRTDTIGVVFPGIDSGFFSEVLKGINEYAVSRDYHLMVAFSQGSRDEHNRVAEYLQAGRVDALILMNLGMSDQFIRRAAKRELPIVLIDKPVKNARVASVMIDNRSGADAAMSHLLGLGYERIAILAGPEGTVDAEQRFEGCQAAADRTGHKLDKDLIWPGTFFWESGYELMNNWLDAGKPLPDAMFALNDPMAMGVMESMHEHGLSVPEDMALIGFDDVQAARYLGLTTVRSPMREMGLIASEAAINLVTGGRTLVEQVLPTELIVRRSCGVERSV
jgi:DNA-binding LacI/PurR family transcriptional regulator